MRPSKLRSPRRIKEEMIMRWLHTDYPELAKLTRWPNEMAA
jgi:hypothetical protein